MAIAAAVFASCGDEGESSQVADVASTIEKFNAALVRGDGTEACRLLTPTERGRVLAEGSCDQVLARQPDTGVEGGDVRDVAIANRLATARLVGGNRSVEVELERIDGTWKVRRLNEVRRGK